MPKGDAQGDAMIAEALAQPLQPRADNAPVKPELILARLPGLRMAAGLSGDRIGHEHTEVMAPLGAAKLEQVARQFLTSLR